MGAQARHSRGGGNPVFTVPRDVGMDTGRPPSRGLSWTTIRDTGVGFATSYRRKPVSSLFNTDLDPVFQRGDDTGCFTGFLVPRLCLGTYVFGVLPLTRNYG
jgi:hypothetical protein